MGPEVPAPRPPAKGMSERRKAVAFVAVWGIALLLTWSAVEAVAPRGAPAGPPVPAVLRIQGPSWTITYEATTRNDTAFGLLREANLTLGFELDWVQYTWPWRDVFVTSINGTRNDGARNLAWQYCVNGVYADTGAETRQIRSGDVVLWAYAPYTASGGSDLCR